MSRNRIGVIVARFQVAELHDGHKKLIQTTIDNSDKVIIFLGVSYNKFTKLDPLSFHSRRMMILDDYPDVAIIPLYDIPGEDQRWVEVLDQLIGAYTPEGYVPELFGSRDSFIDFYVKHNGKHQTHTVTEIEGLSGTVQRALIANTIEHSVDFRKGIIHALLNKQ